MATREWKGKRNYTGKGRMAKGPGVKIKTKQSLTAEAPIQVQQAFAAAMEGLVPRVPTNIDEIYAALAAKYGSKSKAAEAFARWRGAREEVNPRKQRVGILPGMSEKDIKTKTASQRREFERYIIAEDAKGAKGGSQARGKTLEEREDFRLKAQQFLAPTFARDRDEAIATKGVQVLVQGTLRISSGDSNYFERRFIDILIPGHYWRGGGGKRGRMGILDAWDRGWVKGATIRFQRAFAETYELPGSGWTYLEELTLVPPS